jgi:hypothetical protein
MSFINRLAQVTPSQGTPIGNDSLFLKQAIVLSGTGAATNILPGTGAFVPAITKGKLRWKVYAPPNSGVSPALSVFRVVLTDGLNQWAEIESSTTEILMPSTGGSSALSGLAPSGSIPNIVDRTKEFEIDFSASYAYVYSTMTGTSPIMVLDIEIAGTV